jgi:ActR/RegA family two-component response regulator
MRVLIADRNARLLESISRTFAHQFGIQTASTREHCEDLLRQGEFDLAIVCEKLADGPGLQLLGQIAQGSPDTLRIFAARRSRLQLLKGRLGPFGLFRTLSYPIDAQKLLSALVLARAAREIDPPTLKIRHVVIEERQAGEVPATLENEALPLRVPYGGASTPGLAAVRPTVKRFSLTSTDALLSINVPMTIASMRRIRPSESSRVPQLAPVARQAAGISSGVRSVHAQAASSSTPRHGATTSRERSVASESPSVARRPQNAASHLRNIAPQLAQPEYTAQQSALPLPAVAQSAAPRRLPSQSEAFERALARREAARRAANSQIVSRPARRGRKLAHPTHRPQLADAAPKRSTVLLGATIVAVFLVATLALNRFDAATGPSSSARATRTSSIGEQPVISAPPQNSTPASPTPSVRPARSVARRAEPKPDSTGPDVGELDPQMAASSTPIADPSSFGSEAYEAIYSN